MQIPIFNIFNIIVSVLSDDKKTKHQGVSAVVVLVRYAHIHTECMNAHVYVYGFEGLRGVRQSVLRYSQLMNWLWTGTKITRQMHQLCFSTLGF